MIVRNYKNKPHATVECDGGSQLFLHPPGFHPEIASHTFIIKMRITTGGGVCVRVCKCASFLASGGRLSQDNRFFVPVCAGVLVGKYEIYLLVIL